MLSPAARNPAAQLRHNHLGRAGLRSFIVHGSQSRQRNRLSTQYEAPMASHSIARGAKRGINTQYQTTRRGSIFVSQIQSQCVCRCHSPRSFSSSARLYRQQPHYKDSFGTRLRKALSETKIKWYPIPVGLGIGFLGLGQLYRVNEREKARIREEEWEDDGVLKMSGSGRDEESSGRPKRRERIRPTGPWSVIFAAFSDETSLMASRQVQVMSTLPLKAMSRIWGRFNELEIPYYLRVPGFKLYSFIFGVKYGCLHHTLPYTY